jgi:type IV pilus assembly protein PilC
MSTRTVTSTRKNASGGAAFLRNQFFRARAKPKQITHFTRQFAILLDAGLPVVRSLSILEEMYGGELRGAIEAVREDIEAGTSLSEALARQNGIFDALFVNMARAGEAGGVLDEILGRLADFREKSQTLKNKVLGALAYPIAVVTIAASILAVVMIFVIPQFERMFREIGVESLPLPTEILLATARTAARFWYVLIGLPFAAVFAYRMFVRTPRGRYIADLVRLKIPLFGAIDSKSAISRFCRTLGTLLQAGVPILEALAIVRNTAGNSVVAEAIDGVQAAVKEGDSISEPLRHSPVFDVLVVNMVAVGEESGELDRMLLKIADTYESEVDMVVGAMLSLLEPFLIVLMGLAVGFIAIALFLPLLSFMNHMQ